MPAGSKKQVRFAPESAPGEDGGGTGAEALLPEQDEDTLFDKATAGRGRLLSRARRRRNGERWCLTVVMCAAFMGLGMAIAVLGPTFKDLSKNVNSNVANISYIIVGRSFGYLGGSMIGGILFDCMNQHLLLGLAMLWTSIGLYAIPWCTKAILLTALMSVIGISMGFLDTGGNVVILDTWGKQAGPHIQALHFSFALGAVVAPLLSKMALDLIPLEGSLDNTTGEQHENLLIFGVDISIAMLPYIVIGTYILLISLFLFLLFSRSFQKREKMDDCEDEAPTSQYHSTLIFLLFLFFLFYVGAEVAYGSYIFTYATTHVHMDPTKAAGLNSLFWGSFAAVRGLAIFFAVCLYPGTMILLSVIGCTVSSLFLVLFNENIIVLWAGTAVYGASMAATFPSGISWAKQYTTIGGKSASLFVIGAALGEMGIPVTVGFLQGKFETFPVLMYTILGASVITAVLFPVMYKIAISPCERTPKPIGDGEDRKALLSGSQHNEDEDDEDEAQHWNDVDFEVIEMNDTSRNSVIETSRSIPDESPAKVTTQTFVKNQLLNSSPFISGNSPVKVLPDREKND
ncbi:sodium-dependent glucose transporter 1 isoform X2 [Ambystoma mexicanum]|uniref:sodium-dependent glucose transporter 1 isoform X2 n=1 Tax=Ambystoma mexicanum TaxID=8296 RepID=UPI0037E79522